jgi:membrane protein
MWSGALLGAVGFEILKQISKYLIQATQNQPAFQVFGLALILLVWINYFSRIILYAAAWVWTHPLAREQRVVDPADPVQGPHLPSIEELPTYEEEQTSRKGAFVAGAAIGAVAAAAVAKGRSDGS